MKIMEKQLEIGKMLYSLEHVTFAPFLRQELYRVQLKKKSISHAWRREGSFIKTVVKENSPGKRPLSRSHLRWEDCIKKDCKAV